MTTELALPVELDGRTLGRRIELACPCCGEGGAKVIYRVASIPVHSCVLLRSAAEARAFPTRDLELAFCEQCGFVFNHVFEEGAMGYSTNFEESQHFSNTFTSFARGLAREISEKCDVAGRQVLEIGCGKGEFLSELCRIGGASGIGIDPGYRADPGRGVGENVRFIVDRYGPKYENVHADVVLCRHTLEHIAGVRAFIGSIRQSIGSRDDVSVVFETPDALRVLSEAAFWDIYYEHCSYFSPGTHSRLFRELGFDVTELSLVYDGQYIIQYARPAPRATAPRLRTEHDLLAMRELADSFPLRVYRTHEAWRNCIGRAARRGQRIVLWGGGSKGVSFITTLELEDEIAAVVDVNPHKQGMFMPGSGHPVIAPSELRAVRADLVIVMNPIYMVEIKAELDRLDLDPELLPVTGIGKECLLS
jgi:SAM-dependent methyltransferase